MPRWFHLSAQNVLSVFLVISLTIASTFLWIVANDYFYIKGPALESRLFPVFKDWTMRNWKRGPDNLWTADLWIAKERAECAYVHPQVWSATVRNPDGSSFETPMSIVGDRTPGSNRATGWQKINRGVRLDVPEVQAGAQLSGSLLHRCHEHGLTVTSWGPITVAEDSPWPGYVLEWMQHDMAGDPFDYRR